jgi:hypothetical protein
MYRLLVNLDMHMPACTRACARTHTHTHTHTHMHMHARIFAHFFFICPTQYFETVLDMWIMTSYCPMSVVCYVSENQNRTNHCYSVTSNDLHRARLRGGPARQQLRALRPHWNYQKHGTSDSGFHKRLLTN